MQFCILWHVIDYKKKPAYEKSMKKFDHIKEKIRNILVYLWKWIKTQQKRDFLVKEQNIISLGNIARDNWGYLYKKIIIYTYKNLNWIY